MILNQLGIFAKYWQPGSVKTRLATAIGEEAASQVYRSGLEVLLQRLRGLADDLDSIVKRQASVQKKMGYYGRRCRH